MIKTVTLVLALLLTLASCNKVEPVKLVGEAQGTYYMVSYYDESNRNFQKEIDSLLYHFDQSVSLWVNNSIISQVNRNDSNIILDKYFKDNFELSQQVAQHTNGDFDFTIGPLIKAWGFGKKGEEDIDSTHIDSILQFTGHEKIRLVDIKVVKTDQRLQIDFNAIAQGYSVDMLAEFLKSEGISNFIVDIGGEVYASGTKHDGSKWKVGIEKPSVTATDERKLTLIIQLKNQSVATSGNYRKYIEKDGNRYSHIIDPTTGRPAMHNLLSATIVYHNTALADAYATACMVMGLEKAISFVENTKDMEALFIYSEDNEFKTYWSEGFGKLVWEQ